MRKYIRIVTALAGAFLFSCASAAVSGDMKGMQLTGEIHLSFTFAGDESTSGWNKTEVISLSTQPEWLGLAGKGWDAKIFRRISLPAGHYVLSACGKGNILAVQLKTSWDPKEKSPVNLNLARTDWRTDWRPFSTDGSDLYLVVTTGGTAAAESAIKWIKIDSAVALPDTDIPDIKALAKERPSPAIVRGATIGGIGSANRDQNFHDLAALGANVVRFWIKVNPVKDGKGLAELGPDWERSLDQLEATVLAAQAVGLKVVPTLDGGAVADQFKTTEYDYWADPELGAKLGKIWQDVAKKLLPHRDTVWAYDLYNEPLDWSQMPYVPRQWRDVAKQIVRAVRVVDQKSWMVYECGPGGMEWGFNGLKPLPDTRIVYSTHFYSPHEFTHQGVHNIQGTDLAEVMKELNIRYPSEVNGLLWNRRQIQNNLQLVADFQQKYQVPILIGEFSVIRWAPKDDGERYLSDLIDIYESHGWSWIYHSFREFNGWSFEFDDQYWRQGMPSPLPATEETARAKIIKSGWGKNRNP